MISPATARLVVLVLSGAAAGWSCYNSFQAGKSMPWNIMSAVSVGAFLVHFY